MATTTIITTRPESHGSMALETYTRGNDNKGNNENRGRGRNSQDAASIDHRSSMDHPHEDERRRGGNYHPGRTSFTMRILES
ncbi:hypothetical protein P8452_17100 [Trifolium repens]|nr:hypothetical protein P8452_17100 [Trifolium repens]